MAKSVAASNSGISARKAFIWAVLLMAALLVALFWKGLLPGMIVFSNDGPLGIIKEGTERLPEGLKAVWLQKNWVGSHGISASPTLSMFFAWLCALLKGPDAAVLFSKFY